MVRQIIIAGLFCVALAGAVRSAASMDRRGVLVGMAQVTVSVFLILWMQAKDTLFLWTLLACLVVDLILAVHAGHTRLLPGDEPVRPGRSRALLSLSVWMVISLAAVLLKIVWLDLPAPVSADGAARAQALRLVTESYWQDGFVEIACAALLTLAVLMGAVFMTERDGENR